jgi:hypothetical protein
MHEADSYVVSVEDERYQSLLHCRILKVDGNDMTTILRGPRQANGPTMELATPSNPDGAWFMEWSNSLSRVLDKAGTRVQCVFTAEPSNIQRRPDYAETQTVELEIRRFFDGDSPAISRELVEPGDLTQSLCSPWQNDYRECACYYWAASRPDYVNVVAADDGTSRGDNWMQRERTGAYLPDDRDGVLNLSYDDLFEQWEKVLKFVVRGVQED